MSYGLVLMSPNIWSLKRVILVTETADGWQKGHPWMKKLSIKIKFCEQINIDIFFFQSLIKLRIKGLLYYIDRQLGSVVQHYILSL